MAKANYPEQNTETGVYEFLEDISVNTVLFFVLCLSYLFFIFWSNIKKTN